MKRHAFLITVLAVAALLYLLTPRIPDTGVEVYAASEGTLLQPQNNVAIAVLDLPAAGLSFTSAEDMTALRALQSDFAGLSGVARVESILSASRVISEGDDIIVSRAVPADNGAVTDDYLRSLAADLPAFPELSPYVNPGQSTLLFYIYYSNRTPSIEIYNGLKDLQDRRQADFPFEFTGRAPIIAETESLLTKDILVFFPVLMVMVVAVFSLFRSLRALVLSLFLILLSVVASYGFTRFVGIPDSPLILLIPVFSLGLLSDYLIHYFYHQLHTPRPAGQRSLRKLLLFPLSLTALSTLTGFLSLSIINGSGHLQVGVIIAVAVVATWGGVFFWLDLGDYPVQTRPMLPRFQKAQGKLFARVARHRYLYFALVLAAMVWGGFQLTNLSIEPYPIEQLPESTTIKKADRRINQEFYGTLPFFIEIDTGEKLGVLRKETVLEMDRIHKDLAQGNTGYAFSLLSVLKRMNYYFMGSEDSLLTSNEFDDFYDALIEQYLLYYSSSVDPLEYESLLDNSYRLFSVKGLVYYHDHRDLTAFTSQVEKIRRELPEGWTLSLHGMVEDLVREQNNLKNNWVLSFLGGSFLIFVTVLIFYRRLGLALLSLFPGVISMVISFGFIALLGISIDAFSIIFVAIITGLVIDYSIHTLVALDQTRSVTSLEEGFSAVVGYSGIPLFLSFMTSLLSFSVLFLASFRGARNLGLLLLTSLVLSFFLSLYLLPLIILPFRLKKGVKNA